MSIGKRTVQYSMRFVSYAKAAENDGGSRRSGDRIKSSIEDFKGLCCCCPGDAPRCGGWREVRE